LIVGLTPQKLQGTIEPASFSVSLKIYVRIPIIGRVQNANLEGTLLTGITVAVNVAVPEGSAKLFVKINASGTA
jgi:hypothetical protein